MDKRHHDVLFVPYLPALRVPIVQMTCRRSFANKTKEKSPSSSITAADAGPAIRTYGAPRFSGMVGGITPWSSNILAHFGVSSGDLRRIYEDSRRVFTIPVETVPGAYLKTRIAIFSKNFIASSITMGWVCPILPLWIELKLGQLQREKSVHWLEA